MATDAQQDATEITYGRIDTEAFRVSAEALSLSVRQTHPSPDELEEGEVLVFAKENITGVGLYMAYLSGEGKVVAREIG